MRIETNWVIVLSWNLVLGLILMVTGLVIMGVTISAFIRIGNGTLAPWSPTKKLVIAGLYRYVRNPMILGVLTVLLGEATCIWSGALLRWAAIFLAINMIYFIIYEEPVLEHKFGEAYLNYKKNVSRWLPRLTPFDPNKK